MSDKLVKSLGADEVIDYKRTSFKDVVKDVDVVLDILGGQTQEASWGTLKKGGFLVATAMPPNKEKAEQFRVRAVFIFTQPRGEALEKLAEMVDAQQLRLIVGVEIPLHEARQAHESKGGNVKNVIIFGPTPYLIGIICAWIYPLLAFALYAFVTIYFIFPKNTALEQSNEV